MANTLVTPITHLNLISLPSSPKTKSSNFTKEFDMFFPAQSDMTKNNGYPYPCELATLLTTVPNQWNSPLRSSMTAGKQKLLKKKSATRRTTNSLISALRTHNGEERHGRASPDRPDMQM